MTRDEVVDRGLESCVKTLHRYLEILLAIGDHRRMLDFHSAIGLEFNAALKLAKHGYLQQQAKDAANGGRAE